MKRIAMNRSFVHCVTAASLAVCGWGHAAAQAQSYPNKPIRFMVGYPAGGASDITARILSQKLSERLGQPVIVDNRSGGGGIVGVDSVAKAPPDGYLIGFGNLGMLAVNVSLLANLPYNPVTDLAPVTMAVKNPLILVANPSIPVKDVRDLVALAKARPGQLSYASSGSGTAHHLAGALLTMTAGIELVHVPYKGSNPAAVDLIGGQVPFAILDVATTRNFIKAGKMRALGTMGPKRSQLASDVPTISESGLPGFAAESWIGVIAPARTPPDIVRRLNSHLVAILESPDSRDQLLAAGVEPSPSSPEEFGELIRSEISRWAKVIKAAKIEAN